MKKCYVCGAELNKVNSSSEHIIPNAIGGFLKSKDLICRDCNSKFGETCDSSLCKQFLQISTLLNIKRQRKENQPFMAYDSIKNEKVKITAGGKPNVQCRVEKKDEYVYEFIAGTKKEAKSMLKKFQKKYPKINIEEELEKGELQSEYYDHPINIKMNYGGLNSSIAILKIMLNFYIYSGGDKKHITNTIDLIKNNEILHEINQNKINFDFKKSKNTVTHTIIIIGNTDEKILFGFVKLFNFYESYFVLNDNYIGESVVYSYDYDLINNKVNDLDISEMKIEKIKKIDIHKHICFNNFCKSEFANVINISQTRARADVIFDIISKHSAKVSGEFDQNTISKINSDLLKCVKSWMK